MPGRKKSAPASIYSVYLVAYVNEATRARAERGEWITHLEEFTPILFYMGNSRLQAERHFSRAALAAMNNPLAYAVVMYRDLEVLIRLRVDRP